MSKIEKGFTAGKIRFEIESLGPIRDSVIDFKPFLLFSGESNTAKSYTAMAVYYLLFMLNNDKSMTELASRVFDIKTIDRDLNDKKMKKIELSGNLKDELERLYNSNINRFMAYMLGYDAFSCSTKLKLAIPLDAEILINKTNGEQWLVEVLLGSDSFAYSFGLPGRSVKHSLSKQESFLSILIGDLCKRLVFVHMNRSGFFLPPARGALSGVTSSEWKKFSGIGMYKEFVEGLDSVRFSDFDPYGVIEEQKNFVNPLFETLLNGKIKVEKDSVSYTTAGSRKQMPLTAGSSSVKELFPLYLLLNRVPIDRLSICIEEPEAHLHPELQRSAALLLAYIVNKGGFIQITTHSDFFVNQVNNLLKLHFIKKKNGGEFLNALKETGIRAEFVLDPEDMGAYYFEKVKNSVRVRELNVSEKGMPMESFKRAYDQSVKETRNLREALTEHEE